MNKITSTELYNYYGEVELIEYNNKYYMSLENYNGVNMVEITKEAYENLLNKTVLIDRLEAYKILKELRNGNI